MNNHFNVENMEKCGLAKRFFESLPSVFENFSTQYSRRFFMYLFPKDDNLKEILESVKSLIKTSKHSMLTKLLIKKSDTLKSRIKAYKFEKPGEENTIDKGGDEEFYKRAREHKEAYKKFD